MWRLVSGVGRRRHPVESFGRPHARRGPYSVTCRKMGLGRKPRCFKRSRCRGVLEKTPSLLFQAAELGCVRPREVLLYAAVVAQVLKRLPRKLPAVVRSNSLDERRGAMVGYMAEESPKSSGGVVLLRELVGRGIPCVVDLTGYDQ